MESRKLLKKLAEGNDAFKLWVQRRQENLDMPDYVIWPSSSTTVTPLTPAPTLESSGLLPFTNDRIMDTNIPNNNNQNFSSAGQYNFFDTVLDGRTPVDQPVVWSISLSELRLQPANATGVFFVGFTSVISGQIYGGSGNLISSSFGIGSTFTDSLAVSNVNLFQQTYPLPITNTPYAGMTYSQTQTLNIVLYPNGNIGLRTSGMSGWIWNRRPLLNDSTMPCRLCFLFLTSSVITGSTFRLTKTDNLSLATIPALHGMATTLFKNIADNENEHTLVITVPSGIYYATNSITPLPVGISGWGIKVISVTATASAWGICLTTNGSSGGYSGGFVAGLYADTALNSNNVRDTSLTSIIGGANVVPGSAVDEFYVRRDTYNNVYGCTSGDKTWTRLPTTSSPLSSTLYVSIFANVTMTITYRIIKYIPEFK